MEGGGQSSIWAFEPDRANVKKCSETLKQLEVLGNKVNLIEKGLWDRETSLNFTSSSNALSRITDDENGNTIEVTSIDRCLKDEKVTFIKLDIEGSEINALRGAETTIREFHPQMAVCIYHKPEDIWEIPALLLEFNREYKFYLRHYSLCDFDTVLYAIN